MDLEAYGYSYKGTVTDEGKIEGTMPQYIKPDGYDEFLPVVSIKNLFEYSIKNKLKEITIPNTVSEIGPDAFYKCTALKEIKIPDSVTMIENSAFAACTKLTQITIPHSVTTIGTGIFTNWTTNQTINIKTYESAPDTWEINWNENCNAKINWAQ